MDFSVALIGFGEAAQAFAGDWAIAAQDVRAYDRKTDDAATESVKKSDYDLYGIHGAQNTADAISDASVVLSLVTADQALAAAQAAAPFLKYGTLWCDMNSVSPATKRAASRIIVSAGGRYADVAVMAPVHPVRTSVPLLVSGADAEIAVAGLRSMGFGNIRLVAGDVGRASAIKMIRSVMVKGIEALTAECLLAAEAADVVEEVLFSLDDSPTPKTWQDRADYNLDRMLVHGLRRSAEMAEVVKTLEFLGVDSAMSRATMDRQNLLGSLGIAAPPAGFAAKLRAVQRYLGGWAA